MMRRRAIFNWLLIDLAFSFLAVPQPLGYSLAHAAAGQSRPAVEPAKPVSPPQIPPEGAAPAAGTPQGSATLQQPASNAFDSSFGATQPAEMKLSNSDGTQATNPELNPATADPTGVGAELKLPNSEAAPATNPALNPATANPAALGMDSTSANSWRDLLPTWAWLSLLALGIVGAAVAASTARRSRALLSASFSRWLAPRCPYCHNLIARASSRRTPFESWVLPLFLISPVRCLDCRRRYYSLIFFARGSGIGSSGTAL